MIKRVIMVLYLGSVLYVHLRDKVHLELWRQMFDYSAVVIPVNCFMYAFSGVPQTPYVPAERFSDLEKLQAVWSQVRDEGLALINLRKIKAVEKNDDVGFNLFLRNGWKRFYLKWHEAHHPSAEQPCSQIVALLRDLSSVKAAMFVELPSGGKLNPHRNPSAGLLRYHLGLATPNDDQCFIEVDGQRHSWRGGQGVVFDEIYPHWAENASDEDHLILFCDIERPMKFGWAQRINKWLGREVMTIASPPNDESDQTGGINKLLRYVWVMGQYRRRFKAWNYKVYRVAKFGLIIGVAMSITWI